MATEQQNHLKSVTDQAQGLVNEINQLEGQAKAKRDMLLKLQGIIEYLQQTGVQLPKDEVAFEDHGDRKKGDMIVQAIDYGEFTPLLTAAMKEVIAIVETLEAEVAALKG